jgi:hypothetical protein
MDDNRVGSWLAKAVTRSFAMTHKASALQAEAEEAIKAARRMREYLTPILERMAQNDPNFIRRYHQSMLSAVVDAAIRITGADMGNIQLFDPASAALRIEAQRGFSQPFLEFFDCVHDGHAVCGTAFKTRAQIILEDVAGSPIFLGTPALKVVLDAGVRAVLSTPLVGSTGSILGILSTHRRRPWRPRRRDLHLLNLLARNAADWIEQRMLFKPSPQAGPAAVAG